MKSKGHGITTQKVVLALATLAAIGIGYRRYQVTNMKRTHQPGTLYSTVLKGQGFAFKLIQRPNHTHDEPTGILEAWLWPHASGAHKNRSGSPPLHIHLLDDEVFEIFEGEMGYSMDGKEGILKAGQKAVLPAGSVHTFWNNQPDKLLHQKLTTINRSGKHSVAERFFEQWASSAYDYGGIENVPILQMMLMLKAGNIELAGPYPIRLFVRYVVCPFAELLGYKGFYPEYIYT